MKPSRFFYLMMGGAVVAAAMLPWPGTGAFAAFIFLGTSAAALSFDHNGH